MAHESEIMDYALDGGGRAVDPAEIGAVDPHAVSALKPTPVPDHWPSFRL
jgi:hypothetical protein